MRRVAAILVVSTIAVTVSACGTSKHASTPSIPPSVTRGFPKGLNMRVIPTCRVVQAKKVSGIGYLPSVVPLTIKLSGAKPGFKYNFGMFGHSLGQLKVYPVGQHVEAAPSGSLTYSTTMSVPGPSTWRFYTIEQLPKTGGPTDWPTGPFVTVRFVASAKSCSGHA